jgi:hypothetical protein
VALRAIGLIGSVLVFLLSGTDAVAFCLWNCPPSETSVCNAMKSRGVGEGKYKGDVIRCRKVNGYEATGAFGPKRYVMELEITIRFPQGYYPECMQRHHFHCPMPAVFKFMAPGETFTVTAPHQFIKTERGWRGPDGKLY